MKDIAKIRRWLADAKQKADQAADFIRRGEEAKRSMQNWKDQMLEDLRISGHRDNLRRAEASVKRYQGDLDDALREQQAATLQERVLEDRIAPLGTSAAVKRAAESLREARISEKRAKDNAAEAMAHATTNGRRGPLKRAEELHEIWKEAENYTKKQDLRFRAAFKAHHNRYPDEEELE